MVAWRAAGVNYVRFSQVAAEVLAKCTKGAKDSRKAATQTLKVVAWEDGKHAAKKN